MENFKNTLRDILSNLSLRQSGKTSLLKAGIDNYDKPFWVLVPTLKYGDAALKTQNKNQKLISINNLSSLKGSKYPLIIDQESLVILFNDILNHTDFLETTLNSEMASKHSLAMELVELAAMYQDDSHRMEKHILNGLKIPFWNFIKKINHRNKSISLIKESARRHKKYMDKFKKIKKVYNIEI